MANSRKDIENARQAKKDEGLLEKVKLPSYPVLSEGQFKLMKLIIKDKRRQADYLAKIKAQCGCT